MNSKKYLSLEEKWQEDFKSEVTWEYRIPQCEICKNNIVGNAVHCQHYKTTKKLKFIRLCEKECAFFQSIDELKIANDKTMSSNVINAIVGFCIGDMLGVPLEFSKREDREKDPIQEMRAYGTYHQFFGTWSDDSSLTFCLMDSLQHGYSLSSIADKFCKFYFDNYWTAHNEVFDAGSTTITAIRKMQAGVNPINCGGNTERDNGNGSLMRVLPLSFYCLNKKPEDKIKIIEEVSSLTHAHARSKLGCIIYVEYAINLLKGYNKLESYQRTMFFMNTHLNKNYESELKKYHLLLENDISMISNENIKSTGYIVSTLEAALWSFMTSNTYEEVVFKSINLGGDTDTIAAISGGLAGIQYGVYSIPNNWIQCMARKQDIVQLCKTFAKAIFG